MDLENIFNRLTNTINKNRPADPAPVVFVSNGGEPSEIIPNRSPRWQKTTKRIVIIALLVLAVLCLYFLRSMIMPLIFACLMVFYLKPLVKKVREKWKVSHKWAVIIVFGLLLIFVIGLAAAGGFSVYGQLANFFDLVRNSVDSLPDALVAFLGGKDSFAGQYVSRLFSSSQNTEINQQLQRILQTAGNSILSFVQNFSSKIGWFFFVYGFSFFIVWESKDNDGQQFPIKLPGYEYDIEMGRYHLSLIWRRFLWGQMILLLISLVVYTVLFVILGVRYALILSIVVGLTRMIPYIGSFFAWILVGLVALFQGPTIFGMQPLAYAILVVGISFLLDKFMDGFIQPKFLAETLKVHPAAVLTAALICGRTMGFLGIFLSAPLVATIKLCLRYILKKLQDEDPGEGIETVAEPLPVKETFQNYTRKIQGFCDKLLKNTRNFGSRVLGGKDHGSNGY